MRQSILPFVLLASTLAFGSAAFANETPASGSSASERIAPEHGARHGALGYAEAAPSSTGFAGAQDDEPTLSSRDALLFKIGDRGLGNN